MFSRLVLFLYLVAGCLAFTYDVPPCKGSDPATNQTCSGYGYDDTWIIGRATGTNSEKYITVNNTWPPPTISVWKGERIRIKLINQLPDDEPVTLHFHGLLQRDGYVVMDGPQGIVQSGIGFGKQFIYDFPTTQAGTYWVHSHAPGQYPKGLRSPLIIKDPADPNRPGMQYDKDLDFVATVSDWWKDFWNAEYLYTSNACTKGKTNPNDFKGLEFPPDKIIVNDIAPEWRSTVGANSMLYTVPPGKKARLRIINMSSYAQFTVYASDQRQMQIVELDGVLVSAKPDVKTNGFSLASGQRVSIIIDVPSRESTFRILFVAEPIVSGAYTDCDNTVNPCCKRPPPNWAGTAAQFAWIQIRGSDFIARQEPTAADFTVGNEDKRFLKTWARCVDEYAMPYWHGRLKVPRKMDTRADKLRIKDICGITEIGGHPLSATVTVPYDTFGFTETNFQSVDREPAWEVPPYAADRIHQIYMQDHKDVGGGDGEIGRGEMGTTLMNKAPNSLFHWSETDPSRPDDPRGTTLEFVLRNRGSDNFLLTDARVYPDGNPAGEHTIMANTADEVHWLVVRTGRGDHPIHLHGHDFQILARLPAGTSDLGVPKNFIDDPVQDRDGTYGTLYNATMRVMSQYPVRRDTLMIERGWTYVLAFKADNPGVWALHCHNDFHSSTGMMMQVVERPNDLRKQLGTFLYQSTAGNPYLPLNCPWGRLDMGVGGTDSASRRYSAAAGEAAIWPPVGQLLGTSYDSYAMKIDPKVWLCFTPNTGLDAAA